MELIVLMDVLLVHCQLYYQIIVIYHVYLKAILVSKQDHYL